MPYKEKAIVKVYYTVGEVATMFDVATSLLRFWESEFKQLKPKRDRKDRRQYTISDIAVIAHLYFLIKIKGFSLWGTQQHFKNQDNEQRTETVRRIFERVRQTGARLPEGA